jgi:hypothetical protein
LSGENCPLLQSEPNGSGEGSRPFAASRPSRRHLIASTPRRRQRHRNGQCAPRLRRHGHRLRRCGRAARTRQRADRYRPRSRARPAHDRRRVLLRAVRRARHRQRRQRALHLTLLVRYRASRYLSANSRCPASPRARRRRRRRAERGVVFAEAILTCAFCRQPSRPGHSFDLDPRQS